MDIEKSIEELEKRVLKLEKILEEQEKYSEVNKVSQKKEFISQRPPIQKRKIEKKEVKTITFEDVEKNIGKIIGIIAACLILFGISFLAIALDSIFVKVLIMYVISIGLLIFGKKKNYQIIQHCGYMAIYLSFFTTYGYFKLIPEIIFYILILLWLLALFYEQKKDETFSLTGILGLTIVSMFGIYMKKELLSCLSFLILSNIFRLDTKWKKYVNSFMIIISTILYFSTFDKFQYLVLILLLVYLFSFKNEEDTVNIIAALCQSIAIIGMNKTGIFDNDFIMIIISAVTLILFIWIREKKFIQNIPYVLLCFFMFEQIDSLLYLNENMFDIIFTLSIFGILYIFFEVKEYLTKESVYKWACFVLIGMFICLLYRYPNLISIIPIAIIIIKYLIQKKDLLPTYFLTILWIISMILNGYLVFPLLIGLLVQIYLFIFEKNQDKYMMIFKRILNVYLILVVVNSLNAVILSNYVNADFMIQNIKFIYYILIGFGLLTVSVKECLTNDYGIIWIGLKYTLYIWYILDILNTMNLIITIILILIAIVFIFIGFKFKIKMLRLYSLGLTFLSCFKLILFDLTLQNTIQKAVGFIIAGSLCFLIYIIYTKMEKSTKEKD